MSTALAVSIKVLAVLAAWSAVLLFRKSYSAGLGLLPGEGRYQQVAIDSLYYPAAIGTAAASVALFATSSGWRSVKLALIVGGGLFAVLWPFYFLTRAFFANIAFAARDSHRAFAEREGLKFAPSGPDYRESSESQLRPSAAAVSFGDGNWLALVAVASGSVGERGIAQKTRLEMAVRAEVSAPEVWNLKPVTGLLGRALEQRSEELARMGPRVSYIRLEQRKLVLMGAPSRNCEQVAELVRFGEALAASLDELSLGAPTLLGR